jgi:hypothetical protein
MSAKDVFECDSTRQEIRASDVAETIRRAHPRGEQLPFHEAAGLRSRLDEIGGEECERDRHVDLSDAAPLALGNAFDSDACVVDKLLESAAPPRSRRPRWRGSVEKRVQLVNDCFEAERDFHASSGSPGDRAGLGRLGDP